MTRVGAGYRNPSGSAGVCAIGMVHGFNRGQVARTNGRTIVGEPALTVGLGVGDPVKKTRSAKSWSCATFTMDFICRCGPISPAERAAPLLLRRSERGCSIGRAFGMEGGTQLGEPLACAVQAAGQSDRV